ncbi:glycosyltransferase family 4 protein [Bradyrhizobium septentrionale]|uniref:glycosyltransferase family 4 protein n=1 Tax=Bradyrhizobium septentrionale TaxID=1404411 RepID=UPI0030CCE84A
MRKLRVALFVHCFFPDHFYGTETYTLELAKNLKQLGHDVTVVAGVFQGEPKRESAITRYTYGDIDVVAFDKNYVPHSRISETYYQESARPYLRQILADLKPDIVHVTHLINHTAMLLEEVGDANIPVVATITDFFGFCFNNKLEAANGSLCAGPNALRSNCIACFLKASNNAAVKRLASLPLGLSGAGFILRTAGSIGLEPFGCSRQVVDDLVKRPNVLKRTYAVYDALIAPSTFLHSAYLQQGFPIERFHLSHFGVDLDRRAKPARRGDTRITIGYIGQIAAHKGVDLLVTAVSSLPANKVGLKVYGPENQDVAYMAALRAAAGSNVSFHGTFEPDRMADIMSELDLLAIPSTWYENSPLVLLNALASHTPVIVSNVEGLTEFIQEGKTGWSFRRSDREHLRSVIAALIDNPGMVRAATAATSYERTSMTMTQHVCELYAAVLSRRAGIATCV